MEIVVGSTASPVRPGSIARSGLVAVLLVLAGLSLAWLAIGTPLLTAVMPDGRPSEGQMVTGVLAWTVAIIIPAAFLISGLLRLAATLDAVDARRPRWLATRLAGGLGPEHLVAGDLVLPGGRWIGEIVLGPFGMAVLGELPPASRTRRLGDRWEMKDQRGRWMAIEGPIERTTRDADRVRGWLSGEDRDFVVRVYAAVVTDDPNLRRTPSCAVVRPRDLADWLGALPFQRGLTQERRTRLVEMVRSVAAGR